MINKITLTCLLLLFLGSCATSQVSSVVDVKHVSKLNDATSNSIIYNLPKTLIRVEVEAEKQIQKKGPYYLYSQKLLNVSNAVTESKEEWVIKGIKFVPVGVPDKHFCYSISYEGNNVAPLLNLNSDGVLMGINLNKDFSTNAAPINNNHSDIPSLVDIDFNDVPMLQEQLSKTSTMSIAKEASLFIGEIRLSRFRLLSGDFELLPPDGEAYDISLKKLDEMEQSFLELFIGKREKYSATSTFEIDPANVGSNHVLFRFSKKSGVLDKENLSGEPIYISVKVHLTKPLPQFNEEEKREGLFYCRPGYATIKIMHDDILLKEEKVPIAQLGQPISLPPTLLESNDVSIELDPATGALLKIGKEVSY